MAQDLPPQILSFLLILLLQDSPSLLLLVLLHLDHQYPGIHHQDSIHPLQILILMTPAPIPLAVLMILAPTPPTILMTPAPASLVVLMTLLLLNHLIVFLLVEDHMLSLLNSILWDS